MPAADENPGLFTFLVGMIVLVLAGVGLSIVVDKRLHASGASGEMKDEISALEVEAESLKSERERATGKLENAAPARRAAEESRRETAVLIEETARRRDALSRQKPALAAELASLEAEFAAYRENYRTRSRAAAAGEKIGDLILPGGREYLDAVIRKVTAVGIEIRHKHGIARIQAPDLGPAWQERFQWNDGERRQRLGQEQENREKIAAKPRPEPAEIPASVPRRTAAAAPDEIRAARELLAGWRAKVVRVASEKSEADYQAGAAMQTAVPGSLETWRARSQRLAGDLTQARAGLAAARMRLEILSPGDPLLREPLPAH